MEFDEICKDCSPTLSEYGVKEFFSPSPHPLDLAGGGLSDFLLFSVKSEFF
jgi:hypothetical protein